MDRQPHAKLDIFSRAAEQGGPSSKGFFFRDGVQSADDPLVYVMSTETVDRYGDIVKASGWNLKHFRANPIALWQHNSREFPIGTWSEIAVKGAELVGRLNLAAKGTSDFHDTVRSLVEQRILRAVSVGFRPLSEPKPIDEDKPWAGVVFESHELLECSLVSIPANPEALQRLEKAFAASERELAAMAVAETRTLSAAAARIGLTQLRRRVRH